MKVFNFFMILLMANLAVAQTPEQPSATNFNIRGQLEKAFQNSAANSLESAAQDPTTQDNGWLKALGNRVHAEFVFTYDGTDTYVARSDIEIHQTFGNRVQFFLRVNLIPYLAEKTIKKKTALNEEVINAVAAGIAQAARNSIALQFGIPVSAVTLSQAQLEGILAQRLTKEVESFVDRQMTPEAQLNAAVREIGFAVSLFGTMDSSRQLIIEVGKLDPLSLSDFDYFKNHFRISRPAVRLKYVNNDNDLTVAFEVGNDAGLWEIANLEGRASLEYIATIIARYNNNKFFDLTNVNSGELTVIKYWGKKRLLVSTGWRPVWQLGLDTGVDSKYVLSQYDFTLGDYTIRTQGSLEKFDDPAKGDALVKRGEVSVNRNVKGFDVTGSLYSRHDALVKRDFTHLGGYVLRPVGGFAGMTFGVGVRGYMAKYHGKDPTGADFKWQFGGDVGVGVVAGNPSVKVEDVLTKRDAQMNAQRLKELKKKEKKKK